MADDNYITKVLYFSLCIIFIVILGIIVEKFINNLVVCYSAAWRSFEKRLLRQKKDLSNFKKPITMRPFLTYFFLIKKKPSKSFLFYRIFRLRNYLERVEGNHKDLSNFKKPITMRPFLTYFSLIKKEPHRFLPL